MCCLARFQFSTPMLTLSLLLTFSDEYIYFNHGEFQPLLGKLPMKSNVTIYLPHLAIYFYLGLA